ncbi:MAG: glucose-6-phosphate isomerase [Elusimicrobia bacterium]|nr:glucose-6-phosphate isomerase [Elusimicrobiota bacterium]
MSRAAQGSVWEKAQPLIERAKQERIVQRLWEHDSTLWKTDEAHRKIILQSLGWLHMPEWAAKKTVEIETFAREVHESGIEKILLLGMGGSSLAPEVFRRTFGTRKGWPELHVLDSTHPGAVAEMDRLCPPAKTLYVVASKSGTTTEPLRFFDHYWSLASAALKADAGRHFVAITDPASFLEATAKERKFRRIFTNPADIGGRFSALSYFGLVPAALAGIELAPLVERAMAMKKSCSPQAPAETNPALTLGCALGAHAKEGRDKVTFLISPQFASLGLWLEQLIAESTGKEAKGVVPVVDEDALSPSDYGDDRVFVHIKVGVDDSHDAAAAKLEKAGHPVFRVSATSRIDLGAEFLRWELVTAVLGWCLAIDPFDQPDVQSAKTRTKEVLDALAKSGKLPLPEAAAEANGLRVSLSWAARAAGKGATPEDAVRGLLRDAKAGDYIGLLAYVSSFERLDELHELKSALAKAAKLPVQFGYGPRYLHSTGQLHKGGANSGIFLVLLQESGKSRPIPGAGYGFSHLVAAQAVGDFQALDAAGRRAALVTFTGEPGKALRALAKPLSKRLSAARA